MESQQNYCKQRGADKKDLVSGLAYSVVKNYLTKVVEDRKIGDHILFQGGTAFNRAVKAAFEAVLGKKITVPPQHDVLGAIGVAMLARDEMAGRPDPLPRLRPRPPQVRTFLFRVPEVLQPLRNPQGRLRRRKAALLRLALRPVGQQREEREAPVIQDTAAFRGAPAAPDDHLPQGRAGQAQR